MSMHFGKVADNVLVFNRFSGTMVAIHNSVGTGNGGL